MCSYTAFEGVSALDGQRPGLTVSVETPREAIDVFWRHSGQRVRYITIDGRDHYLFFGNDLKKNPKVHNAVLEKYGDQYGERWAFWAVRDGENVSDVFENQEFRKTHGCC